jgi:mRNA-degrading endonuclease RelE of RelBE toxin-antitoxin system
LKVVLTPVAEDQLAALPAPAARRVVEALRLLQTAPRSGQPYPDDSPFRGNHHKTVVVRARRWAYRITYTMRDDTIWVRYLYPSWYPLTHPGLARRDED